MVEGLQLNPEQALRLKGMVEEAVNHKCMMDGYAEKIKDVKKVAIEEFKALGLTPAMFNLMVKFRHKGDARQANDTITEVLDVMEQFGWYSHEVGV